MSQHSIRRGVFGAASVRLPNELVLLVHGITRICWVWAVASTFHTLSGISLTWDWILSAQKNLAYILHEHSVQYAYKWRAILKKHCLPKSFGPPFTPLFTLRWGGIQPTGLCASLP